MKDVDFYELLYRKLRDAEMVADPTLQALAHTRGEAVAAALRDARVSPDRVTLLSEERADAEGQSVPLVMSLGPLTQGTTVKTPSAAND
jgi:hypothetical protein